ncbi:hypothetical protein EV426DRAFT_644321 [Tirmania nivea]|nr:hypothetical protein EV426DRAFT_644321 [Tirmania nivea]
MACPRLRNAHERLQEALHVTQLLPGASFSNPPRAQPPMAYAALASERLEPQENHTMDSFLEVRAGAWRLQQIAYQMYLIRTSYPLSDNPYAQHTAQWVRARAHHARLLRELEQGLANYHVYGLCQVQYLDIETATNPLSDEHEIRVQEGVRTYQVYSSHILLHYRKLLKFHFVDTLHLGPENPKLYLDPQFHSMGTTHSGNSWLGRDDKFHPEARSSRPPTPNLHPQMMSMLGSPLVASPVQPLRPARLRGAPFRPILESNKIEEQSSDEYGESGNDADNEDDGSGDSENGYDEYYEEYLENDTSGDESESDEEAFHGFSRIHISTAGINYLYRANIHATLQVASGVHAVVNSDDRSYPVQLPVGDYTDYRSSSGGLGSESEGGCPLNWEEDVHDENPGEAIITSPDNPDRSLYTESVTTLGGVVPPGVGISEDESEGGVPLYDFDTVGIDRSLLEENNTTKRDLLEQICMRLPRSEQSQDEDVNEEDIEQFGQVSEQEAVHYSSTISHGTSISPSLSPNPVSVHGLAVPREARSAIVNNEFPSIYTPPYTPQAWNIPLAESRELQPLIAAPPNWYVKRSQSRFSPLAEPTVAPTASLSVYADATEGELGGPAMQRSMEERVRAMLTRHMQGNMEERVRAMLTGQSMSPVGPPPGLTPPGPCLIPALLDKPRLAHEFIPPPAYSPPSPPAYFSSIERHAPVTIEAPRQLEPRLRLSSSPADLLGFEIASYIGSISIVGRPGPTWCYQVGEDFLMLHGDGRGNVEPEWRCGVYANRSPGLQ